MLQSILGSIKSFTDIDAVGKNLYTSFNSNLHTIMLESSLKKLAPDLTTAYPASPRETLAGYVIAKRTLDKCRAALAGTNGDYHFDCPLDNFFLSFVDFSAEEFKNQVATGVDDEGMAAWIKEKAKSHESREIIAWNNVMRCKRLCDMPIELQEFLEGYIPQFIPAGKIVRVWFDVYDIEEGRI